LASGPPLAVGVHRRGPAPLNPLVLGGVPLHPRLRLVAIHDHREAAARLDRRDLRGRGRGRARGRAGLRAWARVLEGLAYPTLEPLVLDDTWLGLGLGLGSILGVGLGVGLVLGVDVGVGVGVGLGVGLGRACRRRAVIGCLHVHEHRVAHLRAPTKRRLCAR